MPSTTESLVAAYRVIRTVWPRIVEAAVAIAPYWQQIHKGGPVAVLIIIGIVVGIPTGIVWYLW